MRGRRLQLPPGRPSLRGFTLLELVLVMVVLCIILGMAVPSLRGFRVGSEARDAATDFLSSTQYARAKAAAECRVYRLAINTTEGSYVLVAQDPGTGELTGIGDSFGETRYLPEGMRMTVERPLNTVRSAGVGSADTWIDFYPDGRCDVVTVQLIDRQDSTTVIAAPSPAEPFRVLSPEEAARR